MSTRPDNGRPETRVTGSGEPVTVFAHGLGETISDARVWGSGIDGTKVFLQFRGHGLTPAPPMPWSYDDLVAELRSVDDVTPHPPTRAVGVSLGSAVLIRLLAADPTRFERVALLLPSVFTRGRRGSGMNETHQAYDELLSHPVIEDPEVLKACTASVLVVGQEDDETHPADVAREVAAAFPEAHLEILPAGGILEAHRTGTRDLLRGFFNSGRR